MPVWRAREVSRLPASNSSNTAPSAEFTIGGYLSNEHEERRSERLRNQAPLQQRHRTGDEIAKRLWRNPPPKRDRRRPIDANADLDSDPQKRWRGRMQKWCARKERPRCRGGVRREGR